MGGFDSGGFSGGGYGDYPAPGSYIPTGKVYLRQIRQAARMIAQKGELCSWVQTALTPNAEQPWKTTSVPTANPVSIVFISAGSGLANVLMKLMKGTDVPIGAPRGLMAQVGFTPQLKDKLVRSDGETIYEIAGIDIVAPNGEVILYKIQFA